MQDVLYLVGPLAFFPLAFLFTMACDRLVGPDKDALPERTRGRREEREEPR